MVRVAAVSSFQLLVAGLYSSGVGTRSVRLRLEPEVTSTLPSFSVVAVAYQRGYFMGARFAHESVFQLKATLSFTPSGPPLSEVTSVPPATWTRPSASTACAAQKRFGDASASWVVLPVDGSSTYCIPPCVNVPWKIRILPCGVSAAWIATAGRGSTGPHCPTCAGSVPALLTVTLTLVAVVTLPAASRALAERVCEPFAAEVVSHDAL